MIAAATVTGIGHAVGAAEGDGNVVDFRTRMHHRQPALGGGRPAARPLTETGLASSARFIRDAAVEISQFDGPMYFTSWDTGILRAQSKLVLATMIFAHTSPPRLSVNTPSSGGMPMRAGRVWGALGHVAFLEATTGHTGRVVPLGSTYRTKQGGLLWVSDTATPALNRILRDPGPGHDSLATLLALLDADYRVIVQDNERHAARDLLGAIEAAARRRRAYPLRNSARPNLVEYLRGFVSEAPGAAAESGQR